MLAKMLFDRNLRLDHLGHLQWRIIESRDQVLMLLKP